MVQNNERSNEIIEEYKSKFNQYQLAYNQNQEVIQELTQTIAYLQAQRDEQDHQENHEQKGKEEQIVNEI